MIKFLIHDIHMTCFRILRLYRLLNPDGDSGAEEKPAKESKKGFAAKKLLPPEELEKKKNEAKLRKIRDK